MNTIGHAAYHTITFDDLLGPTAVWHGRGKKTMLLDSSHITLVAYISVSYYGSRQHLKQHSQKLKSAKAEAQTYESRPCPSLNKDKIKNCRKRDKGFIVRTCDKKQSISKFHI